MSGDEYDDESSDDELEKVMGGNVRRLYGETIG